MYGLKPVPFRELFGTAEAVPFQNNGKCRFFDALRLLRMTAL
jgi:hypothetical protein